MGCSTEDLLSFAAGVVSPDLIRLLKPTASSDLNTYKGKEKHPSFAFEVVSRPNRQVMGIATIQPGTRNDKHIVKLDQNVAAIRDKWYSSVEYPMFNSKGEVTTGRGVYFICDGGYVRCHLPLQTRVQSHEGGPLVQEP